MIHYFDAVCEGGDKSIDIKKKEYDKSNNQRIWKDGAHR